MQQSDDVGRLLEQVYCELPKFGFTEHEVELVVQSKQAYEAAVNDAYDNERTVRAASGCIVTDTESYDPQSFASLRDPFSERGKVLIRQRQKANPTSASESDS